MRPLQGVRTDVLLCMRCAGQNRDDFRRRQVLADGAGALGMGEQCCHGFMHSPADLRVRAANSKEAAGGALSAIALRTAQPPAGQYYAALRRDELTWRDPSELARSDEARDALWRDSAALVGLQP